MHGAIMPPEDLSCDPGNVSDAHVVVVHSCDAEVADLDEAWPEGDAVRKPNRSVPGAEVVAGTGKEMAIVTIDLGRLPIHVRDAEVIAVDGC